MLISSEIKLSVKDLIKMEDKLRFDLAIQRGLVWNESKKSLLIHSILAGFPVPSVYAMDGGDEQLWFLDGKQRLNAVLQFVKEEYKLSKDTPDLDGEEIAGLHFSDLPEELQDDIRMFHFTIVEFKNMTEELLSETFHRLNAGVALTKVELTRALAGYKVMQYVNKVAAMPFFKTSVDITNQSRVRFIDQELILQITALVMNDLNPISFAGTDIQNLFKNTEEIPDHIQDIVFKTTEYLSEAFPVNDKLLKKIDVPMIFAMAVRAQEMSIEPRKFSGWFQDFMKRQKPGSAYMAARTSGSAKKENVTKRLVNMEKDFEKNIQDAPEYVIPEVKQSQGRRGRPSKNKSEITEQTTEEQSA